MLPPLGFPTSRVVLEILYHGGSQISVCGDVVALQELTSCWVLKVGSDQHVVDTPSSKRKQSYCVGSGPDKSISAQIATDVGRDDLAVYAITRHEVNVLARRAL